MIAIIPARRDSKRIPKKNVKMFCGKPLIQWTIEQAIESKVFNKIIVDTNDEDIIDLCDYQDYEIILFTRPEYLGTDNAKSEEVIMRIIEHYRYEDRFMLLQVTSPLRTVNDIKKCAEYKDHDVVSVNEVTGKPNGAIWVNNINSFWNERIFKSMTQYVMPENRSIDINTELDFEIAEYLFKKDKK